MHLPNNTLLQGCKYKVSILILNEFILKPATHKEKKELIPTSYNYMIKSMNDKGFTIVIVLTLMFAFAEQMVYAQAPVSKPQRSSSTQQTKPKQTQNRKQVVSGTINGHDYVDLGLSVKWATCNIGGSNPSDYGEYFSWGEISPKSSYTVFNYRFDNFGYSKLVQNGIIDSYDNLRPQYDAACQNWGASWRMPTLTEIKELLDNCKWKWTRDGGHYGYIITGPNGNSIFLPAAGERHGDELFSVGSDGDYRSSTAIDLKKDSEIGNDHLCYSMFFRSSYRKWVRSQRVGGSPVRPVIE